MNSSQLRDLIGAGSGVTIATVFSAPISTIKVNYQTKHFRSVYETCSVLYSEGGVWRFYRGVGPLLVAHVVSFSSRYVMYDTLKQYRNTKTWDLKQNMFNGFMAGMLTSVFSHPFGVMKNIIERGNSFKHEFKEVGPRLLYRSYWKAVCKTSLRHTFLFPVYDYTKSHVNSNALASMFTGLVVSLIVEPLDFLKARDIARQPLFVGWNPIRYYKGLPLTLFKTVPNFTIIMFITESVKNMI